MSSTLLAGGISASRTLNLLDSRIRQILAAVKKTHLEPPLANSDFDAKLLAQTKPTRLPPDEIYKNSLETAFKGILYELAVGSPIAPCPLCG
jgi:THO complex subunit 1